MQKEKCKQQKAPHYQLTQKLSINREEKKTGIMNHNVPENTIATILH